MYVRFREGLHAALANIGDQEIPHRIGNARIITFIAYKDGEARV